LSKVNEFTSQLFQSEGKIFLYNLMHTPFQQNGSKLAKLLQILSNLGIKHKKEAFDSLSQFPLSTKSFTVARKSSFKHFQQNLMKLKLKPSTPGLLSHLHTTLFTFSSVTSATKATLSSPRES